MNVFILIFIVSVVFMIEVLSEKCCSKTKLILSEFKNETEDFNNSFSERKRGQHSLRTRPAWRTEDNFDSSITFFYYKNGKLINEMTMNDTKSAKYNECNYRDKFAFILHGWRESCQTEWVFKFIDRLTYYRGGCIICIDYSPLADASYIKLYRRFKIISNIITLKILDMIEEGFDPNKGYMFGFSFGGQLATAVGRALSPNYIFKAIDTCDMAGPGFDILGYIDHRPAAQHVQCLHSSRDKGTHIYACHQNIRLGNCGLGQPAAFSQPYYSHHGLCVQIYINAFDYPFYALKYKPPHCVSFNEAFNIPRGFTIGYNEYPNSEVTGELFVLTSLDFPYNYSEKELKLLGYI